MRKILLLFVLSFALFVANAQEKTITGIVTEEATGESLVGVTVLVKGTTIGTVTDIDGKFSLTVSEDVTLVVSFVGMEVQEIPVGDETSFNIKMKSSSEQLDDIVVTALGIKRDKKALGYSVQDVKSDEITRTNPTNIVESLSGKVAGAQVVTSSGQVGASTTIKIRGNKSFSGSSQPLFVVDGTPIMNTITSAGSSATQTDFGNAAMDIDPSNIESVSVLKGASAAALYGSRAANGVILITTKKGAKKNGIGVDVSTGISFDQAYIFPDYQNEYGQGGYSSEYYWKTYYPEYETYQDFSDARGFSWSMTGEGRRMDWDESWGCRLDAGLMVAQMDSPVDADGNITQTEWVSHPDNVKDFFQTGITTNNSVALSSSNDRSSGRLTLSHVKQEGTTPNTDQTKINIGLNTSFKMSDRLSFDANVNFSQIENDNLPQQGNTMRNPMVEFNSWFGRQVDTKYLKAHYEDIVDYEGDEMAFNWMMAYGSQHNNPYWLVYKNKMSRKRKRVFGNVSVNYKIAEGIDLMARLGTDTFDEHRKYRCHQYTRSWTDLYQNATNGTFWEQYRFQSETNVDLLLKINKDITEDLNLFATVGGNYRYSENHYTTTSGTNLVVPDFFSTSNFEGEPNVDFTSYEKKSSSVFASANFGYKNYLFLDLTLRGDWSSTLPEDNWNYWYPSANLGFIFSHFLENNSILSYGKLRAGFAQVGSDTDAYQLSQTFNSAGTSFGDVNLFYIDTDLANYELKPEKTDSYEFGAELKFFKNRLGVDFTYYNALTKNQLMNVDLPTSSGYDSKIMNAGSIRNKGVELQVYGTPVSTKSGFAWDVVVNWATNKNKVESLYGSLDELQISSVYSNSSMYLMANPGEEWGTFYGKTMLRNDDGKVVVSASGIPVTNSESQVLGHVNPDWTGGVRNTFSYKNFTISCLVDFRKGGDVFSRTKAVGQKSGILEVTVKDGIRENGMVVDGVYEAGAEVDGIDVSGQENATRVYAQKYWKSSRNWGELSIIDGSFVKLREVTLSYAIPKSLLNKIGIQGATFSVYGHNLALLYTDDSNDVHIDPEVSYGGTVGGTGIESYQMPSSRTLGCKLNFKF